jgi:hypothetical protein
LSYHIPELDTTPGYYYIYASTSSDYSFFSRPTEDIVAELKSAILNGKDRIVFDNMSEAMISEIVKKVETVIRLLDAPSNVRFYFTTSALNAVAQYNEHCKKRSIDPLFTPLVISTFEHVMQANYRVYAFENPGYTIDYKIKNKEKKFVCFNRVPRLHRVLTIAKILELGLFDKSFCSLEGDAGLLDCIRQFLPLKTSKQFNSFDDKMPIRLNITEGRQNPIDIVGQDLEYHENSYFSIVTETIFYNAPTKNFTITNTLNSVFLTEKIFRPIVLKHPFLLVSRPHSLRALRALGYKTFHPYINENYDTVVNDSSRLEVIMKEVDRLCKFTDAEWIEWQRNIKDILDYNHNLLMSKDNFVLTKDIEKLLS